MLNTNLPELKWKMTVNLTFKGRLRRNLEMPGVTEKHQTGKTERQSSSLVSSPTEAKVSWLWLMDKNKEALPLHSPAIELCVVFIHSLCSHEISNAVHRLQIKWIHLQAKCFYFHVRSSRIPNVSDHFGPDWNISTTTEQIAVKLLLTFMLPEIMKPNYSGDLQSVTIKLK